MPTNKVDKSIDAVLRYVWFLGADNDPNPKLRAQAKADLKKLVMSSIPKEITKFSAAMAEDARIINAHKNGQNQALKDTKQALEELFDGSL